ncbi:MAG: Fic family protein [Butyrivibrio sp.]|nr:Fic family protein [Butyrivibrio sp.]
MANITYQEIVDKWRNSKKDTAKEVQGALNEFRILFAYNSNQIDGAGVSLAHTRDIFEEGRVVNYTGDLKPLIETQNEKICFEYITEKMHEKQEMSPAFVKDVQKLLCRSVYDDDRWDKGERPGEYKKNFYGVGLEAGLPPQDVAEEVENLCDELNAFFNGTETDVDSILSNAAYFHCNFENIHPFADGNGRAGRILMNYILLTNNVPPIIFFTEDKEKYFNELTVFDKSEKLDGFVEFMKEQTIKTWSRESRGREFIAMS